METTYKYVGCGGEFDLVAKKETNYTCVFIGGGVGLLALVVIVVILLLPTPTPTTTAITTAAPYDCSAGFANWQSGWSISKKAWCCSNANKGCPPKPTPKPPTHPPTRPPTHPPTVPPTPPPSLPFDCAAGFANWQAGWSEPKKVWCCQHGGKGCPPPPTPPPSLPFDCAAGFANWQAGWSEPKKVWCCQNQGKGCGPAPQPAKACTIWGDPHILTFDGTQADFYGEGIKWIVKSAQIFIQGRYKATPFTNGLAATDAIAVGGPFLHGHVLRIGAMETGSITWDGQPVLTAFPSEFDAAGLGKLTYNGQGALVDGAMADYDRKIVHIDFPGVSLHIQVMRWSHHINVRITMPPAAGGQDGDCGNFNGNGADDTTEAIQARMGSGVPAGESLFKTYVPYSPGQQKTLADCPPEKQAQAKQACLQARPGIAGVALNVCIFDTCMAGPQYAKEDAVY